MHRGISISARTWLHIEQRAAAARAAVPGNAQRLRDQRAPAAACGVPPLVAAVGFSSRAPRMPVRVPPPDGRAGAMRHRAAGGVGFTSNRTARHARHLVAGRTKSGCRDCGQASGGSEGSIRRAVARAVVHHDHLHRHVLREHRVGDAGVQNAPLSWLTTTAVSCGTGGVGAGIVRVQSGRGRVAPARGVGAGELERSRRAQSVRQAAHLAETRGAAAASASPASRPGAVAADERRHALRPRRAGRPSRPAATLGRGHLPSVRSPSSDCQAGSAR